VSDRAKRQEQQSAIWLVSPGVKQGVRENGLAWRRAAKVCSRYAGGLIVIVDPLVAQETVGVLSEASNTLSCGRGSALAAMMLPVTTSKKVSRTTIQKTCLK
jgi:hypothetical protein